MDFIALSFASALTRNLATSALPDAPTVSDEEQTPDAHAIRSGGFRGLLVVLRNPARRPHHA